MERVLIISGFILMILAACTMSENNSTRVVMIALDGISVEGYQKANTPNLDGLVAEGVLSLNTRNVMPSVTLPNWTSHLTGSGPEQHGVVNNGWEINKHVLPAMEKDTKGYYPSLFKVLKDNLPVVKTAFYYNWRNLIYPYNQDYFDEVGYAENDEYVDNYNKALNFIETNHEKPTMVFLYTVHTDHAGHKNGWMSSGYIESIEEADMNIGRFLDQLKEKGLYEGTHFLFLSDHGGVNYGHGGVTTSEMEVPWGITGPGIKKGFILTEPNNTVNTAVVVARLFGCNVPLVWTGELPNSIFED